MACTRLVDEINSLFSWNPPSLIHVPKTNSSKPSSATCLSAFYDKHISSDLVLKKVVPLPCLVSDLTRSVDKALAAALGTLPPLEKGFITAERREHEVENLDTVVRDEGAVGGFYLQTTARYCTLVALMLALHPSFPEWWSLLSWTQSPHYSGYAVKDAELRFIGEGYGQRKIKRAEIVKTMDSKVRAAFEDLRESMSCLAIWKMTSVTTGSLEVMAAVRALGEFSWTYCDTEHGDAIVKHVAKKEKVRNTVRGPDAKDPPWRFPREDCDEEIDRLVTQQVTQSFTASGSSINPPPSPTASRSSERTGTIKKRKRDHEEAESGPSMLPLLPPSASWSSERGSPMKDKGKKPNRGDEDQDWPNKTAQSLVQQAWARAVRVDGTVIILHSGNHELVCLHHRRSQTLYVSELIIPSSCSNPGYGKLHLGIYITAIQDAMDRWQQRSDPVVVGS